MHSGFAGSMAKAKNLEMLLEGVETQLESVDDYDVGKAREKIRSLIEGLSDVVVNVTGGTKPMSIGALEAAWVSGAQAVYVRSQGLKTGMDFYGFDENGSPFIRETVTLHGTISLNDYLVSYFGDRWSVTGFGGDGDGRAFEQAIFEVLQDGTDEVISGWRDASNQVEIDFVIRCNNQVGIIQAKTGKAAMSMEGIKQLAVGGGQRFFGTYVRRFLVIDRKWDKNERDKRELCEALNIALIELPGFGKTKTTSPEEREKILKVVESQMGKSLKAGKQ